MDCFEQDETHWRIRAHLRSRNDFRALRVDLPWQELPPMDLILTGNVPSYFGQAKRAEVLGRPEAQLAPDGTLLLGVTERNEGANNLTEAPQGAPGFYLAAAPREPARAA